MRLVLSVVVAFAISTLGAGASADPIPPTEGRMLKPCHLSAYTAPQVGPCVHVLDFPSMPPVGVDSGDSFRIYRSGFVKRITDRRGYQLAHGMPNHD